MFLTGTVFAALLQQYGLTTTHFHIFTTMSRDVPVFFVKRPSYLFLLDAPADCIDANLVARWDG